MIKNYLILALKSLKRKKLYTLIMLLGICLPLIIITLVVSFLSHITVYSSPESRFSRVISINHMDLTIKKNKDDNWVLGTPVPFKLYKEYYSKLRTPQLTCFSFRIHPEVSANNIKKEKWVRYCDDVFWKIADYQLIEGRFFNQKEVSDQQLLALIDNKSKEFYFGKASALGQKLNINHKSYTIIGVVKFADETKIETHAHTFVPLSTNENFNTSSYFDFSGNVLALLKDIKDSSKFKNEIQQIAKKIDKKKIDGCTDIKFLTADKSFSSIIKSNLKALFDVRVENSHTIPLSIILVIFFFLILPALNLIYINQSRFSERLEEVGIRKSFGGTNISIIRQFIIENTFITILGGLISFLISSIIIQVLNELQIIEGCYIDLKWQAFLISLILWFILSLLSGILPAVRLSKSPIIDSLQTGISKSSINIRKIKKDSWWLCIEICFMTIALFAILNFLVFFGINVITPKGFSYKNIFELSVYNNKFDFFMQKQDENFEIVKTAAATPFVEDYTKLDGCQPYHGMETFNLDMFYDNKVITGIEFRNVDIQENSARFFNIEVKEGSWLNRNDTLQSICPVLINENLKNKLFGNSNAIGKQLEVIRYDNKKLKQKIIIKGIVSHYKHAGELLPEGFYVFMMRNPKYKISFNGSGNRNITGYLKLKPNASSDSLLNYLRTKYPDYSIDLNPILKFRSDYLRKSLIPVFLILFLCFSVFFIILVGMFGVMWYNINLKIPEIGLRKSVGASNKRIFKETINSSVKLGAYGLIPGILLVIQIILLKIFDFPWQVYLISAIASLIFILFMIIVFTILPAIKATKTKPAVALHQE